MPFDKPFHRIYRAMANAPNSRYSDWAYIVDREYAKDPVHYVRSYLVIQQDLLKLFEFVEPADTNLATYSIRTHELLMRTCVEVEANCRAILRENGYAPVSKSGRQRLESEWKMPDYRRLNDSHHLSSYSVELPVWRGSRSIVQPFAEWANESALPWYQAYNECKHDRHKGFEAASFENLIAAVCGLVVLLSSQFRTEDFSPSSSLLALETDHYRDGESAIGGYFRVFFPEDWAEEEKYSFNWAKLKTRSDRFQKYDFNGLK